MYLHIGNNRIIKKENILFLLNYEKIQNDETVKKFLENIEEKIDYDKENPKTIVITKENDKVKAYVSNISSTTIAKRNMF